MGSEKRQGMSVNAFAKEIGVTENAVRSRIKSGKRVAEAVYDDGSLDADRARALWFVDLDSSKAPGRKVSGNRPALAEQAADAIDLNRVKAEREEVALARERINLAKEEGSVIDRAEAKRGAAAFARVFRDSVLNFAARKGPDLAHRVGVEPRQLIPLLEAELREMLVDMSKQPMPFE